MKSVEPGYQFLHFGHRSMPQPVDYIKGGTAVDFLVESLERGDFYILCPDNDVPRKTDERRILWAAGDIVENRPPLSRWHSDYADAFNDFMSRTT